MGRGRLAGCFDEVPALGPAAFSNDVGTNGSGLRSGGNVLLVLPVGLRSFVWKIEKSEKSLSRALGHTGVGTVRFAGVRIGNLLG